MRLIIAEAAERDQEQIFEYIARNNLSRAASFLEEIQSACFSLTDYPKRFPLVPRYERYGIRRRVLDNYLIFYIADEKAVHILRVLNAAIDYEPLLFPNE